MIDADPPPMTIAVMGMGYVGLVTSVCMAALGHSVVGVDVDRARVSALRRGHLPFSEPDLSDLAQEQMASGHLVYADDPAATRGADAVMVAVGTLDRDGEWTANYVEEATSLLARDSQAPRTIVVRSTLMPGTTARLADAARNVDPRIDIAFNPEFTRQGSAVADFMRPDRIVIGITGEGPGRPAADALRRLYAPLSAPIFVTDATSAEMIKVGSNVFLSLKVGFANEIARLSAATGAEAGAVIDGIGLDQRIGRSFLSPGPGYGGSCLPSQARALPRLAEVAGVDTPLIAAVDRSNRAQAEWVADTLADAVGNLDGAVIGLLGLTFKPGTDDVRESPALGVARALAGHGAMLSIHDPVAVSAGLKELARSGIDARGDIDPRIACQGAAAVVIATEWPDYKRLDWSSIAATMTGNVVVDARGIVDVAAAQAAGLEVIVHGRHADRSAR